MNTPEDILGNPLKVGDRVVFTRYHKTSSLYIGKIVKETEVFFIIHEIYTSLNSGKEECYTCYDRRAFKMHSDLELLKI